MLKRLAEKKPGEQPSGASPGKAAAAPAAAVLYLAAGTLQVVGPFAACFFLLRARQEFAVFLLTRDAEMEARILRSQIGLAELREQARAFEVDPALVAKDYRDLRDGLFSFDEVRSLLKLSSVG